MMIYARGSHLRVAQERMEMIMFRTSSVFMCCLLFLLISLPKSHSQPPLAPPLPPPFSDCKEQSYSCGNLAHIFYPFWGKDRPRQCGGGDQFKLNCRGDDTTILIGSQNFRVTDINTEYKSMRLVKPEFADVTDVCSLKSEDVYVNSTKILYRGSTVYDIIVFYDCPSVADFTTEYKFTCGNNFTNYVVDMEDEKLINELSRLCKGRLHVPTDAVPGDYAGDKKVALKKFLERGFEVNYNASQDCERCLGIGDCLGIEKDIDSCYYCIDGSHDCYHHKNKWNLKRKAIVGVTAGAAIAGVLICMAILYLRYKSSSTWPGHFGLSSKNNQNIETFLKSHGALSLKRYKLSEVKKMTNNLKVKLGQGGFGAVYKGELLNGSPVAVKILNASKGNGEDFINEVASISRTSHVNVVSLLGFCLEGRKKALIYEFMPNGSLDKLIYGIGPGTGTIRPLSWDIIYQISTGIARGLEYLHRGCNTRILHFDIKPHNVLLDEKFCPKIADFGLAKICSRNKNTISMSDARGTMGYVAPEMWSRHLGGVSHKSDVYSYGMMLLEMVGGRKNIDAEASNTSEIYFPHWAYNKLELDNDLRPDLMMSAEENEIAKRLAIVSLWCIQTFPDDRPTMSRVIDMLEGSMNSLEIPPKPLFSSPITSAPESSIP